MKKALLKLHDKVFRPSLLSFLWLTAGNGQTLLDEIKSYLKKLIYGDMVYDKKETFMLSDGGNVILHFKGKSFRDIADGGQNEEE